MSKEFIHSNKKELQAFIRNGAHSTNEFFKGYKQYEKKKDPYENAMDMMDMSAD